MYYLNLTLNLDKTLKAEALDWVKTAFIPKIMDLVGFSAAKLLWVKTDAMATGITYAVQFETDSYETLEYFHKKEELIYQWLSQKNGDKILPFATELHIVETFYAQ